MTRPDTALPDETARLARDCVLMTRARALADAVGEGRPVTATGVLGRTDIAAVCSAAALPDPGRKVSAADVPALHRAWVAAQGAGLIVVGHRTAHARATTATPTDQWRDAVAALLRAESHDDNGRGAALVCDAVLDVLASRPGLGERDLGDAVDALLDGLPLDDQLAIPYAFLRGRFPEQGALEILGECGAVDTATLTVTSLGRALATMLTQPLPTVASQWAADDTLQVRIDLDHVRPPVWRRLRLPAHTTLAELHDIIQIVFDWDDDHLHVFTTDDRAYADPHHGLDGTLPEGESTLAEVLPREGARIAYRYDLGDCWDHTVLLESGGPDPTSAGPTCVDGRGDAPVEDWVPDEDTDDPMPATTPFDLAAANRHLAGLHDRPDVRR